MVRTADWNGLDQVSIEFLTSQKHQTQLTYKSFFRLTQKHFNMTGQQMVDSKRADKKFEWERRIVELKQWVKTQRNNRNEFYSDSAASTAVNCVRSFFDYYRTPLVFSQNESRKIGGKIERKTRDYMLTNTDMSKMLLVADLREKYVVTVGKTVGFRVNDFLAFTYGTFRSLDLSGSAPVFMGEIVTGKELVSAFPFIDADALPIVKAVLDGTRDKPNDTRIITVKDEEVNKILQGLALKAGLQLGGKRIRFHCFRKYLIDRLSACMSESKWKQIVGKALSEDAYVSSFELRNCYLKAMELTTIGVNENGKVSALAAQITQLNGKVDSKEKIIDVLIENGKNREHEFESLKAQVEELNKQLPPEKIARFNQMLELLKNDDFEVTVKRKPKR